MAKDYQNKWIDCLVVTRKYVNIEKKVGRAKNV